MARLQKVQLNDWLLFAYFAYNDTVNKEKIKTGEMMENNIFSRYYVFSWNVFAVGRLKFFYGDITQRLVEFVKITKFIFCDVSQVLARRLYR